MIEEQTVQLMQQSLTDITHHQISAVLNLMQEGNTVPFIARYRKEMTGSLDEVQIQAIEEAYKHVTALQDRKEAVIKSIAEQGKLTPELERQIHASTKLQDVEDIYLPYKQKRQTKATIAKERGLEPFARWLLSFPTGSLNDEAQKYVNPDKEITSVQDVLDGAHEILAETFSEIAAIRNWVRNFTMRTGIIRTTVKTKGKELDEKGVYQQFYDFEETIKKMTPTRTLAINRGEKEKILTVKVQVDPASVMQYFHFKIIDNRPDSEATAFIEDAYQDAYKRFVGPAIEREVRGTLTVDAEEKSIKVFGQNLYNLLMQAPIKGKVVLGFDPAYRTGCKLAVLMRMASFSIKRSSIRTNRRRKRSARQPRLS